MHAAFGCSCFFAFLSTSSSSTEAASGRTPLHGNTTVRTCIADLCLCVAKSPCSTFIASSGEPKLLQVPAWLEGAVNSVVYARHLLPGRQLGPPLWGCPVGDHLTLHQTPCLQRVSLVPHHRRVNPPPPPSCHCDSHGRRSSRFVKSACCSPWTACQPASHCTVFQRLD